MGNKSAMFIEFMTVQESMKVLEWTSYLTIGFWICFFKIQGKQLVKVRKKKDLSSKGVVNNFAIINTLVACTCNIH